MFTHRFARARSGLVLTLVLLTVACGADRRTTSAGDKAGADAEPVVLTMAGVNTGLDIVPAVAAFVDELDALSGGRMRVHLHDEWGDFADDAERQVVGAVADDTVDLGYVGTRAFESFDIGAFRALNAPMLIDSYPLQAAVIASDIPNEMLGSLHPAGVTGLAVLADGLRKPMAVDHFLVAPADYDGITFTAYPSATLAAAITALGASPDVAISHYRTEGLQDGSIQGFEMNLRGYQYVDVQYLAPYVTANVNLWANPTALIANPDALADLTGEEHGWLTAAAEAAAQQSTAGDADDASLVSELCSTGTRFAVASAAELSAMREAFAPVYATLSQDPETAEFIDRITALKSATDPGADLDIPADCTGRAPIPVSNPAPSTLEPDRPNGSDAGSAATGTGEATVASAGDLAGTYRWTITVDDARTHGTPSDQTPSGLAQYPEVFTVVLSDDTWTMPGECEDCAYHVDGDHIVFDWNGVDLTFTFAAESDGSLQLRPAGPMNAGDAFIWTTEPWERLD